MPGGVDQVTMRSMTLPYIRPKIQPLSADEQAEQARRIAEMRSEIEAEWAAQEPVRRMLVESVAGIKDVEAAVECRCSCHGKPGKLHDRGVSCPCQQSEEERQAALDSLWSWNSEEAAEWEAKRGEADRVFQAEAARLGVEIESHGGMAPYVICGVCDGRAFFLRERHDIWRVEIGSDQEPLVNPWGGGDRESIVVGEGLSEAFAGEDFEIEALRTAVSAVRTFIERRRCEHTQGGTWCSNCGVRLEEAEKWRIWT